MEERRMAEARKHGFTIPRTEQMDMEHVAFDRPSDSRQTRASARPLTV